MTDPLNDTIAAQYTDYPYPVALDHPQTLRLNDPKAADWMYWPRGRPTPDLDILVAGCGLNQAAEIAFHNPESRVVGIDVSRKSLGHAAYLKDMNRLDRLELHCLPVERVADLGRDFDLVIATGVLHHLADPTAGLKALADVLRPHGSISLMQYGKYGRTGVYMLQDALRRLGAARDADGLKTVRDALQAVPERHPVLGYMDGHRDDPADAGLVDSFLNARDVAYTVPELMAWIEDAGLRFQTWLQPGVYDPTARLSSGSPLRDKVAALAPVEQAAVIEGLVADIHRHDFCVCKSERPVADAVLPPAWWQRDKAVPRLRMGLQMKADAAQTVAYLFVPGQPPTTLAAAQARLLAPVDGSTPVGALCAAAGPAGETLRGLLAQLWRAGIVEAHLPPA